MPPTIDAFLCQQAEALTTVHDRATLSAWHRQYFEAWTSNAEALTCDGNQRWGLSGNYRLLEEVAYLAVEQAPHARGDDLPWILLAANPGWPPEPRMQQAEMRLMGAKDGSAGTPDAYEAFRSAYFPRWMDEVVRPVNVRRAAWWNHALVFVHEAAGLKKPGRMGSVHPQLDLLGWDLWPVRSTRDGLTGAAIQHPSLAGFARASLQAAVRMPSRGVIVASAAGLDHLEQLLHQDETFEQRSEGYVAGIRVRHLRHAATGRDLWAIRRQLFAGFGVPSGTARAELVAWVRGELDPQPAVRRTPRAAPRPPEPPSAGSPIALARMDSLPAGKDLLWVRHVVGNASSGLEPLPCDADEHLVHQRIGGYWALGLGKSSRVAMMHAHLASQGRLFVAGILDGRVIRVVQVAATPDMDVTEVEHSADGATFRMTDLQPDVLQYPVATGLRWATQYVGQSDGKTRYRLHTITIDDEAWRGRELTFTGQRPQNPGLYVAAETAELKPLSDDD